MVNVSDTGALLTFGWGLYGQVCFLSLLSFYGEALLEDQTISHFKQQNALSTLLQARHSYCVKRTNIV